MGFTPCGADLLDQRLEFVSIAAGDAGDIAFARKAPGNRPARGVTGTDDACGEAWNTTLSIQPTIADIEAMADCGAFDLGDEFDGFRCTRITTTQSHSGIPEFSVVVAFKVF